MYMKLETVKEIVSSDLAKYDLKVTFPIRENGRLRSVIGRVMYQMQGKTITVTAMEFSRKYLENATDEQITGTIHHEAAHAIATICTGVNHSHDQYWKSIYYELDPEGHEDSEYTNDSEKDKSRRGMYKYVVRCSCCHRPIHYYYRRGPLIRAVENYPHWYKSKCCNADYEVVPYVDEH